MDSISSSPFILLASIAIVSFIALISRKLLVNSLLMLAQSILIGMYYWTKVPQFSTIKIISLILILLFLVICAANFYLQKTTQLIKPSPSTLAIPLGALLFLFFAFVVDRLKGSELITTYEFEPFITDNMLGIFVVIFTIFSMLISANAIIGTKNTD